MLPTRLILLCSTALLVTACAAPTARAPVPTPPVAEPAPVEAPPAAPALPPLTPPQAQKMAIAAADLLEAGNEEQAKADLQRVLASEPGNKLAQNLLRQITADPVAVLGRESFPYTVRSSDTLSRIAGRFLGDIYSFYILARYNDIKIPRQVAGGQVIRIPGKAPPPGVLENEARKEKAAVTAARASSLPVRSARPFARGRSVWSTTKMAMMIENGDIATTIAGARSWLRTVDIRRDSTAALQIDQKVSRSERGLLPRRIVCRRPGLPG